MNFEKQEINKFDGFNSNVAPELLKDEAGTGRDIMNFRSERIGKLVTRNGYRICPYGDYDISAGATPDFHSDMLYRRNGGTIGIGEFSQSHKTSDNTDRYLVNYIRALSTLEAPYTDCSEDKDYWKFPQRDNTAPNSANREHLAGFIFSPIDDNESGTLLINNEVMKQGNTSVYQLPIQCDLNPQDGMNGAMKNLYAPLRDLSVSDASYTNNNLCHRVHDVTSHNTNEDSIDKRYVTMNQYRQKLIVSDKLNGDMAIENIWDSQTDLDEEDRTDGFRIRANCVEDFDINKVYLDARLLPNQENSSDNGVKTGMALYQFALEKDIMVMSNPMDTGEAVNPDNYKVYQENPPNSKLYPTNDTLKRTFFGMSENVMFANITIGKGDIASRILNRHRIFTNASSNTEYSNLLSRLKFTEYKYYDDKEDKEVTSKAGDVYVWEDMQMPYYPSQGIDTLSFYLNSDNRIVDQANANAARLTNLEVQDGIGRKAPIGGWRYRFVWDYGNGDYSAPSTEMLCPDIMWSASRDDDVVATLRDEYDRDITTSINRQAVVGTEWDKFKSNGFNNISVGYTIANEGVDGYYLTPIGKLVYDVKAKLYKDMRGKYGIYGTSNYDTNGRLSYTDVAQPWESYNVGDFACNIMLKAPEHSIDLKGIIAEFAAFDCKHGTGVDNNIENGYRTPDGFIKETMHAMYATFKIAVPTFPYENRTVSYGTFERFALMNGIFDYYGRYRAGYRNSKAVYNTFFLMPSWCDTSSLGSNISTQSETGFFNQGIKYYGVFHSIGANHSNRFYLCVEGGLPDEYLVEHKHSDIHNVNSVDVNGTNIKLYNKKPETLLRAYKNDSDSPVIMHYEVPAEVNQRILLGGHAKLDISTTESVVPLYPHAYGGVPSTYKSISQLEGYDQSFVYGWETSMPENSVPTSPITFYTENSDVVTIPDFAFNVPNTTGFPTSLEHHLLLVNCPNKSINGLYMMTYKARATDNGWHDVSQCELLQLAPDSVGIAFIASLLSFYDSVVTRLHANDQNSDGLTMGITSGNPPVFTRASFMYNASLPNSSYELVPFQQNMSCPLADFSVSDSNRTEVSVYLPGHRSTLLEQVISIFPSSLLHKCPRVAIKIPEYNIPKKAKRLLIYRTLNSLSNEYDPLSYGLVKAFEIRRANKYDTGLICEEDRADIIARPVNIDDVITSEYNYTDPNEFILDANGVPTIVPVGAGGTDNDCYNGIYFFDDVRDTIVDFSNNPDQYEALRYALKSAHNIAIAERMFYGNVIQQYQPEAPMAFNNNRLVNKDNAINNVFYITGKANGSGLAPASQYVQYAYVFEDEMQIKSQVELTDIIQLKSNAVEILGWDGQGTQPVIADSEQRDIALYFVPGSYTNGIKRTIVYRKMWATSSGTPNTETYVTGFYQVGEIDNKKDKEGIFVDDGLPNGTMLPIKQVNHNGDKWVFDTPPNSYEYESGVFWSEPYRPDVIKMENFMEFGSGDGGQITGLQSLYGNIVVFKNSSIYRSAVQAENPPISRVDLVSRYEGCIAPNSLLNVEDTMFFLSSGGFMQYDNNVIKAADDAFHDELMFLLKSNEMYNEEASAAYNQHFKEIYLNVPKLKPTVKWIDIVKDIIPDYAGTDFILGQYNCLVDTNDSQYYDTMEWQDIDSGHPEKIFNRETYGHIFVINQHNGYNTKFGYPATSYRKLYDNSSYFPIFAYHSLHLMRKYYTSERGVLYSGDVIPHWYGVNDGGGQGSIVVSGRCVDCDVYFPTIVGSSTFPLPNDRRDNLLDYDTEQDIITVCNFCQGIREITVNLEFEYTETPFKPPVFWAGLYSESPCTGDSALQYISTNNDYGQLNYVKNSYSEMDMFLNHRELYKLLVDNNFTSDSRPTKPVFPKIDSIEINNVFKSKFYTAGTETVLKRLRSAGINMFAKGNIRVLYTQFPVESVDSGIRYTPLPEIFLSLNNNFMEHTVIQSRYNYPPTTDVFNKWLNTITVGSQENVLYFVPDTRMANNRYKGQVVPFNDDIGKPLKFSIEIYSQGRTQINALTYHIRHIWSYLR